MPLITALDRTRATPKPARGWLPVRPGAGLRDERERQESEAIWRGAAYAGVLG
jgi:hypothetical protein